MENKYDLFEVQPEGCREPLAVDAEKIKHMPVYIQRILLFTPTEIYERLRYKLNPYNRYNWQNIQFAELFPAREDKTCPCGCGQPLKGGDQWASNDCQFFVIGVWNIIGGRQDFIAEVFKWYYGDDLCHKCRMKKIKEWDHVLAVSKGGGGSWLNNFQGLCKGCHTAKTREDFNWVKLKKSTNYDFE